MTLSPELIAIRDRALGTFTCEQWAGQQGWKLIRSGAELVGTCPKHCAPGHGGKDRFQISSARNVWLCRQCGVGGDVIFLVMHTENLKFVEACERITGDKASKPVSPDELARLEAQRKADQAEQERTTAEYREKARREARVIWEKAGKIVGIEPSSAGIAPYLTLRGLAGGSIDFSNPSWALDLKLPIRFQPQRAYWHDVQVLHTGPAMIAAIQMPDGRFAGVHQTYLDLDQPKGKLVLPPINGKDLPAKKVFGIKKGCAIRLVTPAGANRMVMGEGIETTLTAVAFAREDRTAYWAGVDLGNMSGKAARNAVGGMVHDQPDMADLDCFQPPDWVEELVYLCDGDEAAKHTVEKVKRGLRRAKRRRDAAREAGVDVAPLSIKMVPPGAAGSDLNSLAMGELDDEGGAA